MGKLKDEIGIRSKMQVLKMQPVTPERKGQCSGRITKVSQNHMPQSGGYGKLVDENGGQNSIGFLKLNSRVMQFG